MCGIVGTITKGVNQNYLINGLKELEYRGYDSAGISILNNNDLKIYKAVGKLNNLESKLKDSKFEVASDDTFLGIGHTRWATHGKPTELNAHPHLGEYSYVVHNGIIENYKEIRDRLLRLGKSFISQTDTEVIVHLFESYLDSSLSPFDAFKKSIDEIEGSYAILLISKSDKDKIFFAKKGSPLIISNSKNEIFFSSSDTPLIGYSNEAAYLDDNSVGFATKESIEVFVDSKKVELDYKLLPQSKQFAQKDGFRFFMEKEIYEQSSVVLDTIRQRVTKSDIDFDEIDSDIFKDIREIKLCACGTSYHAAMVGAYLFERDAKIRCSVEIASEFRYKNPYLSNDMLFIVISQSGETADTLEALKMAKNAGLKSLALCNVDNSSMVREADYSILLRAGIEKGVASTKAFATQVLLLWMLSIYSAKSKNILSKERLSFEIDAILSLSNILKVDNSIHEKVKRLSKRYLHGHGFFFIGRDIFYPLALEGALKLKEISYLHAEGYPAGEMKHGPIALADPELFTIALLPKGNLYDKIKSNIEEIIARDSTVCVISSANFDLADDFIKTKEHNHIMLEFFEMMIVEQLLSMEISIRLGNDIDMPRNLAKSVTVE